MSGKHSVAAYNRIINTHAKDDYIISFDSNWNSPTSNPTTKSFPNSSNNEVNWFYVNKFNSTYNLFLKWPFGNDTDKTGFYDLNVYIYIDNAPHTTINLIPDKQFAVNAEKSFEEMIGLTIYVNLYDTNLGHYVGTPNFPKRLNQIYGGYVKTYVDYLPSITNNQ
jgi:hypothetical protein